MLLSNNIFQESKPFSIPEWRKPSKYNITWLLVLLPRLLWLLMQQCPFIMWYYCYLHWSMGYGYWQRTCLIYNSRLNNKTPLNRSWQGFNMFTAMVLCVFVHVVSLCTRYLKKYTTDRLCSWWKASLWGKDEVIQFWEKSAQRRGWVWVVPNFSTMIGDDREIGDAEY